MTIQIIFVAITIASWSIVWRKMLHDLPQLKQWIAKHISYPLSHAVICGFCFTYWTSLIAVLIFNPLDSWQLPLRSILPALIKNLIHLFASWMIVAFVAITFRYLFVVIQELLDYEMYVMNKHFHPLENEGDSHNH